MQKVTIEKVFRTEEEGQYGPFKKVALKIKETELGGTPIEDRWISALAKKDNNYLKDTEGWNDGDSVYINFVVTEKGYFNFDLPDEKDLKIAKLEAEASKPEGETPSEPVAKTETTTTAEGDVDPEDVDF